MNVRIPAILAIVESTLSLHDGHRGHGIEEVAVTAILTISDYVMYTNRYLKKPRFSNGPLGSLCPNSLLGLYAVARFLQMEMEKLGLASRLMLWKVDIDSRLAKARP